MNQIIIEQWVPRGWKPGLAASPETKFEGLIFGLLAAVSLLAILLAFAPMG